MHWCAVCKHKFQILIHTTDQLSIHTADNCLLPLLFLRSLSILSCSPIINICICLQDMNLSWIRPMAYHPHTGFHYFKKWLLMTFGTTLVISNNNQKQIRASRDLFFLKILCLKGFSWSRRRHATKVCAHSHPSQLYFRHVCPNITDALSRMTVPLAAIFGSANLQSFHYLNVPIFVCYEEMC